MYPYFNPVYGAVPQYTAPGSVPCYSGYMNPNPYVQLPQLPIAPQPELGKLPNLGDLSKPKVLKTITYESYGTSTYCDVSNILSQLDDIINVLSREIIDIADDRIIYFYHKCFDTFNYNNVVELTKCINERTALIIKASNLAITINQSTSFSQEMIDEYHSVIETMNNMTVPGKFE